MTAARLVELVRNGVVESVHLGHVALCGADGELLLGVGDPALEVYVRSAAKPFQAAASLELASGGGLSLDLDALAIAAASHTGSAGHQVEAARLLALAGLDEAALRCPADLPSDLPALLDQRVPTRLAHNCSGKHAAFLVAHTAAGGAPERYLHRGARLQRRVRDVLAAATGCVPVGPGVDGCGAPAWRLPLRGLATGFARLAGAPGVVHGTPPDALGLVAEAMRSRPHLVGGPGAADTELMLADRRTVAKRGAEGVLALGVLTAAGPVGAAVKVADGAARATLPAGATLLRSLGADVAEACLAPAVLGGGEVQGRLQAVEELGRRLEALAGG